MPMPVAAALYGGPARARLHHLRPHLRRLRAGRRSRSRSAIRRPGSRSASRSDSGARCRSSLVAPVADRPLGSAGHRADGRPARRSSAASASATAWRCSPPPPRSRSPSRPSAAQTDARPGRRPLGGWQGPRLPATRAAAATSIAGRQAGRARRAPTRRSATGESRFSTAARSRSCSAQESRAGRAGARRGRRRGGDLRAAGSPGGRDRRATTSCTRATIANPAQPGPDHLLGSSGKRCAARPSEPRRQPGRVRARDRDQQRDRQARARHEEGRQLGPDALRPQGSPTRRSNGKSLLYVRSTAHGDKLKLRSRRRPRRRARRCSRAATGRSGRRRSRRSAPTSPMLAGTKPRQRILSVGR